MYKIVSKPVVIDDSIPELSTSAMVVSVTDQVPSGVLSLYRKKLSAQRLYGPEMVPGTALMVSAALT